MCILNGDNNIYFGESRIPQKKKMCKIDLEKKKNDVLGLVGSLCSTGSSTQDSVDREGWDGGAVGGSKGKGFVYTCS